MGLRAHPAQASSQCGCWWMMWKVGFSGASFCTTEPKSLKIPSKYKVFYIPNPVDESFEKLENYKNKNFNNDVFFAMSHGVHRGVLKKGKFDQRENFINKLISVTPNIRFDLYGMNGVQPVWADNYLLAISQSKIGLNLSQGKPAKFYSSDRFAQLIGNGLLVMVDEKTKIGNFFTKNTNENKLHNQFALVWKNKCEQIIMKAKFSMKDDKETLNQVLFYAKKLGL